MFQTRNKQLLFNPVFIGGLLLLAMNDHYFKWQYPGLLTGKLSDVAGLLIFPLFLAYLFPSGTKWAAAATGAFFVFWKLPISQSFISFYNKVAIIPIHRTVDYTDLVALAVLPLANYLIQHADKLNVTSSWKTAVHPLLLLLLASFLFMATSPPISYYMRPGGDVYIGKTFKLKMSKEQVLEKLKKEGYTVREDTTAQENRRPLPTYILENVVLSGGRDTIKQISFSFMGGSNKTLLLLHNVSLTSDRKITDWRELKRYAKYYRKTIDAGIIDEIK